MITKLAFEFSRMSLTCSAVAWRISLFNVSNFDFSVIADPPYLTTTKDFAIVPFVYESCLIHTRDFETCLKNLENIIAIYIFTLYYYTVVYNIQHHLLFLISHFSVVFLFFLLVRPHVVSKMWIKSHTALSVSEETILNMSGTITTDHVVETLKEIILVDEDEENSEGGDYVLISTQNPHAQFLSLPIWHYDMRDKVRDVGFFSDATRQVG